MYITTAQTSKDPNRVQNMFIFLFKDEQDLNKYAAYITYMVESRLSAFEEGEVMYNVKIAVLEALEKLLDRVNNKYPRDGYELSGIMFADEMAQFSWGLSMMTSVFGELDYRERKEA
jgi:uncharacterized protein YfbU (UPF0304 family)